MTTGIGYCISCTNQNCSAPRVIKHPQRDCPKGQSWTDGEPMPITQKDMEPTIDGCNCKHCTTQRKQQGQAS